MKQYLIVEVQNRADGVNNVLDIVARNSLASGLSYYYDRCSKMAATTLYPTVTLVLMDTDGVIYENKHLTTAYEPEPEE
jgi:hypothetical protein